MVCLFIVCLSVAAVRLANSGYLPQPFVPDVNYPLIGLFETAFWAHSPQTYGVGASIYPPLSFLLLRVLTNKACYAVSPAAGRDCDVGALALAPALFLLAAVLVYRTFRANAVPRPLTRTAALMLSLPMLYALECGNLILAAFCSFVVAYRRLPRATGVRAAALALTINLKPYLLLLLAPAVQQRRWLWVLAVSALSAGLYFLTVLMIGGGGPLQLIRNLLIYGGQVEHRVWNDFYYSTSYWPLVKLLELRPAWLDDWSPVQAHVAALTLRILMHVAQGLAVAAFVVACLRSKPLPSGRLAAMLLATVLATLTTGQSGYVQIFLLFLVLMDPWEDRLAGFRLTVAYILCLPADLVIAPVFHGSAWSYLGGRQVVADFGLSVGQLLRPGLLIALQFSMTIPLLLNRSSHFAGPAGPVLPPSGIAT